MDRISIEQLINMNCIRYDRLTQIVNTVFAGSKDTSVNIYIDLYSILKQLYSNKNYAITDYSLVTSCVINLAAHYREFFRSRYNVSTTFYLVYSKNCNCINKQFLIDYNTKNEYMFTMNKKVDDMIANNIDLLKIIVPYLPDIHLITGEFETGVIMYDIICRNEVTSRSPHIIITKDIYNYQLVSMRNNIVIFRPKKTKGEDASYWIGSNNLYAELIKERKVSSITKDHYATLLPGLYTMILALSSVPERNIKSLYNVTTAFGLVNKAVSDYSIINGYNTDINFVIEALSKYKPDIISGLFGHRFKAIDIQFQHSIFVNTVESKLMTFENFYDPENVKQINNQYFRSNPLDLNRL